MIKKPAARIIAAAIILGGLTVAPLLDNSEPPDPPPNPGEATRSVQFQIHWRGHELALSGHTRSLQHEQSLAQVADASFANSTLVTEFEPLGTVPDYWADLTTQILYLLAETSSAEAIVSIDAITIRGVVVNELAWKSRLNAIRNAVPEAVSINTDTLLVDDTISVSTICARALEAYDVGAINFEESSTEFRASAYPRLDRLLALVSACDKAKISITGHTDATGSATWNQRLSLQRAKEVGDYLLAGGVDPARLWVVGAGSAYPIADDSTRYGRSLNRRIDISLELANASN